MVAGVIPLFALLPTLKVFVSPTIGAVKDVVTLAAITAAAIILLRRRVARRPIGVDGVCCCWSGCSSRSTRSTSAACSPARPGTGRPGTGSTPVLRAARAADRRPDAAEPRTHDEGGHRALSSAAPPLSRSTASPNRRWASIGCSASATSTATRCARSAAACGASARSASRSHSRPICCSRSPCCCCVAPRSAPGSYALLGDPGRRVVRLVRPHRGADRSRGRRGGAGAAPAGRSRQA